MKDNTAPSTTDKRILRFIMYNGPATHTQLVNVTGCSPHAVAVHCQQLKRSELITFDGGRWRMTVKGIVTYK